MVSLRVSCSLIFLTFLAACSQRILHAQNQPKPTLGIERTQEYLPLLKGKKVGLVVNHTSVFPNHTHLVDSLVSLGIQVKAIFGPEHGFRGKADAGDHVSSEVDKKTGISIISLYGSNRKPKPEQIKDLDILLFDIQDVGVRFYTYTSTMHYLMEAAAEQNKDVLIFDRPNPLGHIVDGPVLDKKFSSFLGLNPVPIVHGCTVGELAQLINGERWLAGGRTCKLQVITCLNYTHQTPYTLPIAPSPNLPNQQSVLLYPSICLFEATEISVGRGTDTQFQVIGGPSPVYGPYEFTPVDKPGAMNPPNEGVRCYGLDLRKLDTKTLGFSLKYVLEFAKKAPDKAKFMNRPKAFDTLAGNDILRQQVLDGKSESEIRASWQPALDQYKSIRKKYVLYP